MTGRIGAQPPESPWLIGIAAIANYGQTNQNEVNEALLAGELRGLQRRAKGTWRSKREWVDAWIETWDSATRAS